MRKIFSPKGTFFFFENTKNKIRNSESPYHYHNYYELYFLVEGTCRYFINNTTYDLTARDVVIIPKGIIHKTVYKESSYFRKLIYCSSHYIPYSFMEKLPSLPLIYRNPDAVVLIEKYFGDIEAEYTSEAPFKDEAITAYFHMLLLTLFRYLPGAVNVPSADARVSEILEYLKNNFRTNCTLEQTAQELSVSPEHLSRTFKAETGLNFSEYRTMLRLREADRLLKEKPELSIIEISYASGFNDSNYFSQKFREYYGVSPSKFRQLQK